MPRMKEENFKPHLPLNNVRQEKFCHIVVEAPKGITALNAAIEAGYSERSAHQQGYLLMNKPRIQQRIAWLREQKREPERAATMLHKGWVLGHMQKLVEFNMEVEERKNAKGKVLARRMRNASVARLALFNIGVELGMFVQKAEQGKPGEFKALEELSDRDIERELEQLAQDPEGARALAAAANVIALPVRASAPDRVHEGQLEPDREGHGPEGGLAHGSDMRPPGGRETA